MLYNASNSKQKKIIFIRISEKCSCNCVGCLLPKVKQNKDISVENLDKILNYINNNFWQWFEINYIGYNTLEHGGINYILQKKYNFPFSIHIDYNDIIKKLEFLQKSEIEFTIQKNIYSIDDFKKAVAILHFVKKHNIKNILFYFLFNFSDNRDFIQYFIKNFDIVFENSFTWYFFIWQTKIVIENIYSEEFREKCNFTKSYSYMDWKIYINDNIEICLKTLNIKTHLSSYCNLWIYSLWNIFYSSEKIYKNFQEAYHRLRKIEYLGAKEKCKECIKNPIKF